MGLDSKNLCPICKKPRRIKKVLGVEFVINSCDCADNNADEYNKKEKAEKLEQKYNSSNIPIRYKNDMLHDWVSKEEIKKMEQIINKYYESMIINIENGVGIILAGKVGVGKTRIICWLASRIIFKTNFFVYFITVSELIVRVNLKFDRKWIDVLKSVDVLVLDDFSELDLSDAGKTVLSSIVNHRYNNKKPIYITTMKSIEDITFSLGEHILSRIIESAKGYIVEVDSKNMRYEKWEKNG